jgi:predicted DNA-binding transcriptional regulator YafY
MPSKVIYERFLWFHKRVKAEKFPNTRTLAERFEITRKTAQRDIEFMRDRLGAPLAYMPAHRGFAYEDNAYELTGLWLKEEELISLLVSYRVASLIPDSTLKGSMKAFLNQALTLLGTSGRVSMHDLNEKVSVKNIGYSRTGGRTFHQVLEYLLRNRPMRIVYYSPHNDESTARDILPLHLLHYMGTWHLIAHCALRGELRYFTLSRIGSIRASDLILKAKVPAASIKDYIRRNFGILMNEKTFEVCLRFSSDIAPWVAEQVWHPKQITRREPDGTLCLSFPVADFREIKREVLKYGSQVEVLSPESLRKKVRGEIERMRRVYE